MWYGNGKESQKCMLKGWLWNQVKVRNTQNLRKYTDIDKLYNFSIIWDFRNYIGQKKALGGWFFSFFDKKNQWTYKTYQSLVFGYGNGKQCQKWILKYLHQNHTKVEKA